MGRHSQSASDASCSSELRAAKPCESDLQPQPLCSHCTHFVLAAIIGCLLMLPAAAGHGASILSDFHRHRDDAACHGEGAESCSSTVTCMPMAASACISTLAASVRTPVHELLTTLHLTCAHAIICCAQLFPCMPVDCLACADLLKRKLTHQGHVCAGIVNAADSRCALKKRCSRDLARKLCW